MDRLALYLCDCGPNISGGLDLDALGAWAEERSEFALVARHELLCSPGGREEFRAQLAEFHVDGVVVAGCTPRMHEKTFRDLAVQAGLNFARAEMANIREQCAWVTDDRDAATEKAKALILAAAGRVEHAQPLEERSMEVLTDLLVVGGGIAGIETALTASRAGRRVTIVEKDISLGGTLIRAEEVTPSLECAPCVLAPQLAAVRDDDNITVLTNAEVTKVTGFYGNFAATVRVAPRFVKDSCIGCEACFDVCPVEVESEFHLGLGTRKAIHALFPGSVPAAAAIDADACLRLGDGSCGDCVPACPFGSIDFEDSGSEVEVVAGAVVLATGVADADLSGFPELALGRVPDVYTLPEFERLSSSLGPTGGKIATRDGESPASIVFLHCAGSLREDGVPWCSGTCCGDALAAGILAAKQLPETQVSHVHDALVLPGPKFAALEGSARAAGVGFVRCGDLAAVEVDCGVGGIRVGGGGLEPLTADMVVLVSGAVPSRGTAAIADMLALDRTPEGFLLAGGPVLGQTECSLAGVYAAGAAAGPCDAATAVTRARAAAGDAISRLVPGRRIDLEAMTTAIDPERCAGCRLCLPSCPFRAITYDSEAGVCEVNEAICRGCGTCAAGCPSGAARSRHFSDEQIFAEIAGVIDG